MNRTDALKLILAVGIAVTGCSGVITREHFLSMKDG